MQRLRNPDPAWHAAMVDLIHRAKLLQSDELATESTR
jgi:hypothetical protein